MRIASILALVAVIITGRRIHTTSREETS